MTAPTTYRWDTHLSPYHPGLGDVYTSTAGSVLAAGASVIAAAGISTGAALSAIGIASLATGPLAPFVAAAGALVVLLGQIFSGCGQTCTLASSDANQVEAILKNNLTSYLAGGHTQSEQQAALAVFNYAAQQLQQACGQASLGQAGQNCISQRLVPTACQWKTSPGGWNGGVYTYPGAAGSGSTCWNWIVGYYDPIANDPTVVPDPPVSAASTLTVPISSITGTSASGTNIATGTAPAATPSNLAPILLAAGALLLLVALT